MISKIKWKYIDPDTYTGDKFVISEVIAGYTVKHKLKYVKYSYYKKGQLYKDIIECNPCSKPELMHFLYFLEKQGIKVIKERILK